MGKTIQVRLPAEVVRDAGMCARAFDEGTAEYVTRVLREATKRDLPRAAKIVAKRAEQAGHGEDEA